MILDVWLSLFISPAVGLLHGHKAPRLIEPPRPMISLERPEAQIPMEALGDIEETASDP
jgi:hypothetical protein